MGILSVDLGTSNTVAVLSVPGRATRVVEVDGSATMPSAVFAEEGGELLVGRDAERRARLDPTRFEPNPKRRVDEQALELGTDSVPVDEALAAVLRRVYDETVRQLGGTPPEQIRLTHPAEWGPRRREVLLAAARGAGMDADDRTVTLVPEPVAAAAHFASFPGKSLEPGRTLAVYDLGAGTFDVAVLGATPTGFTVLAEEGLPDLGGLDVDRALLEHVGRAVSHSDPQRWQRLLRPESTTDRRARRTLLEDVKAAKEALSRLPRTEVPMPEPFTDVVVTRSELEALVRPTMLRSVELLEDTVRAAGVEPGLLADIYLVGGSSRLPLVGGLIEDKLGVSPSSLDQPETAVAFGAHHVGPDGRTTGTEQVDGATLGAAGATSPALPPVGPTGQGPRSPHTSGPYPPPAGSAAQGVRSPHTSGPHPPPAGSAAQGVPSPHTSGPHPVPAGSAAPPGPPRPSATPPPQGAPGPQGAGPGPGWAPAAPSPVSGPPAPGGPPGGGPNPTHPPSGPVRPARRGGRTRWLVASAIGVVAIGSGVGAVLWLTSGPTVTTYTAAECAEPGSVDAQGFTGCLRQLAGTLPEGADCEPGTGTGPAAAAVDESELGASVTCSAPGLPGAQITYLHGRADDAVERSTQTLLTRTGGLEQVRANWRGNALDGSYAATSGRTASVLVFTVPDRPVAGFVYQLDVDGDGEPTSPDEMADYFERTVQPGE